MKRCAHKNCGQTCRWDNPKKRSRKKNPLTVRAVRKGIKKAVRTGRNAVTRGSSAYKGVRDALHAARDVYRALHPGKPLPASLAGKKKRRQKNPRTRNHLIGYLSAAQILNLKNSGHVVALYPRKRVALVDGFKRYTYDPVKHKSNPVRKKNQFYWIEFCSPSGTLMGTGRSFSQRKNALREARRAAVGFEGKVYVVLGTVSEFDERLKILKKGKYQ